MNKRFYRTYVIHFSTSEGEKVYAGKHVSSFPDENQDPYRGSGRVITRAIEKYGRNCITSIQWKTHHVSSCEELDLLEIEEIRRVREVFGLSCVNLTEGGNGGDTYSMLTETQRMEISIKLKESAEKRKDKILIHLDRVSKDPEVQRKKSESLKEAFAKEDVKQRLKEAAKKSLARPEVKRKLSEASRKRQRSGGVWDQAETLKYLWESSGKLKGSKFSTWLRQNTSFNFTGDQLKSLLKSFEQEGIA